MVITGIPTHITHKWCHQWLDEACSISIFSRQKKSFEPSKYALYPHSMLEPCLTDWSLGSLRCVLQLLYITEKPQVHFLEEMHKHISLQCVNFNCLILPALDTFASPCSENYENPVASKAIRIKTTTDKPFWAHPVCWIWESLQLL